MIYLKNIIIKLNIILFFLLIFILSIFVLDNQTFANNSIDTISITTKNFNSIKLLAENNLNTNPELSLKYSLIFYNLALKKSDNVLINNSLKLIALSHKNLGNNYESINYFKIFIENKEINDTDKILVLNYLGELYRLIGQLNKSIDFHIQSLDLAKTTQQNLLIPDIFINIGIVYRNIGDYITARKYYDNALLISLQYKKTDAIINSLQAIGNWHWYSNNNDSALYYYKKANEVFHKNANLSKSFEIGILNNIGNAYRSKQMYNLAFEFYYKALIISETLKDNNLKSIILKNLGITHFKNRNNILAINYFKQSNKIAEKINLKRIIVENYHNLFEIYKNTANYKMALESYINYDNQKDSIFLNDNNYKISELELKYKNKENQEIISQLQLNKEKNLKLLIAFFLLLFLIITILLYKQFKFHKKESEIRFKFNNELTLLNDELTKQNEKINENKIQISDSEILFRTIFEGSPLGNILLDPEGNILKVNDALMKIIGYKVYKEIISQNIFQFPFLKKTNILNSFSEAKTTKNVVYGESVLKNNIGLQLIVAYHISPILNENGELIKIHAVATDITEDKKRELSLKDSENKLIELNATKDKFLSIIAHDIKNPFNAIMGFSNLLKDDYESFTNEERLQFIGNISQASEDVFNLLENLLKWSWAQSGIIAFNQQNINLFDIISETISLVKLQCERKNIEIKAEISSTLMVYADINMLKTVFRNLISNAIKFTPNGGNINISYAIIQNKSTPNYQFVQICIKDSGIGISKENLSKIFKIEEKITSKGTNGETGTGLGLILCKEFITKNGGKIWVESEENKVSSFYFTVSLAEFTTHEINN